MSLDREQLEQEARRLSQEGSSSSAAALVVRGYGPEILGFLSALQRREEDADDVFALWSERVLRGLPSFGWECSLRTWAYTIARNTSSNFLRDRRLRDRRAGPLPDSAEMARVEQQVRSDTRPYLRTEVKSKLIELRDSLPEADRALLVLRLDKRLEWKDVARVMLDDGAPVDAAALTREAQRLRKRFQGIKEQLVEAGRRAGILPEQR